MRQRRVLMVRVSDTCGEARRDAIEAAAGLLIEAESDDGCGSLYLYLGSPVALGPSRRRAIRRAARPFGREARWDLDPMAQIEACPGCGKVPGEGLSSACDNPEGCGYWRKAADAAFDRISR